MVLKSLFKAREFGTTEWPLPVSKRKFPSSVSIKAENPCSPEPTSLPTKFSHSTVILIFIRLSFLILFHPDSDSLLRRDLIDVPHLPPRTATPRCAARIRRPATASRTGFRRSSRRAVGCIMGGQQLRQILAPALFASEFLLLSRMRNSFLCPHFSQRYS